MDNQSYHRTLICITGMSPQVVTETVYALAKSDKTTIETTVHIITTSIGAQRARAVLLGGKSPKFKQLCDDYNFSHFNLQDDNIHVVKNELGLPLADIRTHQENGAIANTITEIIRFETNKPNCSVHVSMAGGRKTMGFYAGYAISMFGRTEDRLSHVLVSEHFENHADFFYPSKQSHMITAHNGLLLDTSQATITLANIPFVRMRHELPTKALIHKITFSEAVDLIALATAPPSLVIDLSCRTISVAGKILELDKVELIFYLWFIKRLIATGEPVKRPGEFVEPDDNHPDRKQGKELVILYTKLYGEMNVNERTRDIYIKEGMTRSLFESKRSKIKKKLEQQFGPTMASKYEIKQVGTRGNSAYTLTIAPEFITIRGGEL